MDPISLQTSPCSVLTRVSQHTALTSDDSVVRDRMISGLVVEGEEGLALTSAGIEM